MIHTIKYYRGIDWNRCNCNRISFAAGGYIQCMYIYIYIYIYIHIHLSLSLYTSLFLSHSLSLSLYMYIYIYIYMGISLAGSVAALNKRTGVLEGPAMQSHARTILDSFQISEVFRIDRIQISIQPSLPDIYPAILAIHPCHSQI